MFWFRPKIKELETINYELTRKIQSMERDFRENTPTNDHEALNLRKENSMQHKTISDLR